MAGKRVTTLLPILIRQTPPTAGGVDRNTRLAPLLEPAIVMFRCGRSTADAPWTLTLHALARAHLPPLVLVAVLLTFLAGGAIAR
jgi:hypothetical protein